MMPVLQRRSQDAGERVYAYAKACGNIGKSFVGKRISELKKLNTLIEFDRLVFPDEIHELPGRELLQQKLLIDLENRILKRTIQHILAVVNSYSNPPELLVRQLRSCEYADLKTCIHHIAAGKSIPSRLSDIGRFGTVRFDAYPDLKAMLKGTEFDFILSKNLDDLTAKFDLTPLDTELDMRYYTLLLESLGQLSVQDRLFAQRILAQEISLQNCVWALRLRSYFNKTSGETAAYIMDLKIPKRSYLASVSEIIPGEILAQITDISAANISLAAEACELLHFPLDSRSEWSGWRWELLLNPEQAGVHWVANPRFFQNAASWYIYRLSMHCFRRMPFSVSSIFCYIKLKLFEEDVLTSIAEGLGLGMDGTDVFNMLEVPV
jgi:vacuolar-type H+-ATPase subunit C/Vma6